MHMPTPAPRCPGCFAPVSGCLCSGADQRKAEREAAEWRQLELEYDPATDARRCPGCGATRMSATESCACGHGWQVQQQVPRSRRERPPPSTPPGVPSPRRVLRGIDALGLLLAMSPDGPDE